MPPRSATITVMIQAAYKAARGLVRDFGEVENLQVSKKGPADFVTAADIQAEKTLRWELNRARPNYAMLLEESGAVAGRDSDYRWIVDPLDGTLNFLHGIPHFCISIGLEQAGEMIAGVIYDPLRDELFHAEKGAGAYLNDHRIRVSSRDKMMESVITTGIPAVGRGRYDEYRAQLSLVMEQTAGIRRMGSAALDLAYVAAGRCEGFWEPALSPWDIAAGIVILREAGGYVTDFNGAAVNLDDGDILAANDRVHGPLKSLLAKAKTG